MPRPRKPAPLPRTQSTGPLRWGDKQTDSTGGKHLGSPATGLGRGGRLSHYDALGQARMVDVSTKQPSRRSATASAFIELSPTVLAALPANPKGDPLEVARFAGIQAAKRTSELIPMCHPLPLSFIDVTTKITYGGIAIHSIVATTGPTGVEMEALTAASVAALTIYD